MIGVIPDFPNWTTKFWPDANDVIEGALIYSLKYMDRHSNVSWVVEF